jgi:hypothetical protein
MKPGDNRDSADTKKDGNFSVPMKVFELLRERQVSEVIAIVGKEFFLPFKIFLDCFQALADVGMDPGVRESDPPVMDVTVEQF